MKFQLKVLSFLSSFPLYSKTSSDLPFFYIRTKIDKTTAEDKQKFPRTFCEERVVQRIRERCRDSIATGKVGNGAKAFAVSAVYKDKWDFRALIQGKKEIFLKFFI